MEFDTGRSGGEDEGWDGEVERNVSTVPCGETMASARSQRK